MKNVLFDTTSPLVNALKLVIYVRTGTLKVTAQNVSKAITFVKQVHVWPISKLVIVLMNKENQNVVQSKRFWMIIIV